MVLKIKIISFEVVFIALMHLFMFGRVAAYAFDVKVGYFSDARYNFNPETLFRTGLYILCSISSLFSGLVFSYKNNDNISSDEKYSESIVYSTGLIIFIVSSICKLYIDFQYISVAQSTGLYTSTTSVNTVGIIDDFGWLIIPGYFLMAVSGRLKKRTSIVVGFLIIAYMLITSILTGIRRFQVAAIVTIFLFLVDYYRFKINLIIVVITILVSYFFMELLKVIRYMRFSGLTNLSSFISQFSSYHTTIVDTLWETLTEFGTSFFSVANILVYVPAVHFYQLGLYFVYCIVNILPVGFLVGSFLEGSLAVQADAYMHMGVGGSLFTDMYANFGYFGVLGSFFSGVIISKVLLKCGRRSQIIKKAQYYTLVFAFFIVTRGSLQETVRFAVWGIYIPIIIMDQLLIRNRHYSKRQIRSCK